MLTFTKSEDGRYINISNVMRIELNSQELPIKLFNYVSSLHNFTLLSYEYRHNNLSTLTIHYYDTSYSLNYTHDDKNSPFYHCNTPKWYMLCRLFDGHDLHLEIFDMRNNRLTGRRPFNEEVPDILNYLYTYDDAGFPLICKRERNGVVDGIIQYTYVKK